MKFFKKKVLPPGETDDIPEKVHKNLHAAYFFIKGGLFVVLIFYIIWIPIQLLAIRNIESQNTDSFFDHGHSGTFFIEKTYEECYGSKEAYEAIQQAETEQGMALTGHEKLLSLVMSLVGTGILVTLFVLHKKKKLPHPIDNRYAISLITAVGLVCMTGSIDMALIIVILGCLYLGLRCGDRKRIFIDRSSDFFIIGGLAWLMVNLYNNTDYIINMDSKVEGMIGIFSRPVYYCQVYRIFVIPLLLICGGLMLRRHELEMKKADTSLDSKILKVIAVITLAGAGIFVAYRLGVRIYELARVMAGDEFTVKVPYTRLMDKNTDLIDIPYEAAKTPQDYKDLILFRFVRDLPVFIISSAAVVLVVKIIFNISNGEINTRKNRKYLKISMAVLFAASLIVNLMGLKEVDLFRSGFTGIYGEAGYTMAVRTLTDPLVYVVMLLFFETYLQAVPEKMENK